MLYVHFFFLSDCYLGPAWVNGKALLNNKSLSIPKVSGKWIDAMGACPIGRWLPHLAPGKDHAFVFDKHVGMVRHSQSRKKTTKSPAAILQSTMERRGQSFAWSKDEIAASHRSVSPDLNLLAHFFDEAAWVDSTGAQSNPWHEPCGICDIIKSWWTNKAKAKAAARPNP